MLTIARNIDFRSRDLAALFRRRPAEDASHKKTLDLEEKRSHIIQDMARLCRAAGADVLEIGLAPRRKDAAEIMALAVSTVQQANNGQICLSTQEPEALEAGIRLCRRPPIVNYVSMDTQVLQEILPLAARHHAEVVIFPCEGQAPTDAADFFRKAAVLVGAANEAGISNDRLFIDLGVIHINSDLGQHHAQTMVEILLNLPEAFDPPLRSTCFINNISAGTPRRLRSALNNSFLALLAGAGLHSAFVDALDRDVMRTVRLIKIFRNQLIYADGEAELR
ncbi:MAG: dihydropteroate synthase [Chloroflexi bacterium]|nr:dihydropteroate synthase [Chloroflexota bacterium]